MVAVKLVGLLDFWMYQRLENWILFRPEKSILSTSAKSLDNQSTVRYLILMNEASTADQQIK
jgi:hypothetical protein